MDLHFLNCSFSLFSFSPRFPLHRSNGKINSIEGVAKVQNSTQPAILGVSFFKGNYTADVLFLQNWASLFYYYNALFFFYPYLIAGVPDAPYWVLSTDYQSYALVYSCSDYLGFFHIDFAWILARTRVLTEDVIGKLHERLASAGVNTNRLTVTDQTGCDVMTWGMIRKM